MTEPVTKSRLRLSLGVIGATLGALVLAGGVAELASTTSCAATAPNNPLRSFENARDVDVVCMQTLVAEDGGAAFPVPLPQAECTPVPVGLAGTQLPNHLYALVTQEKRGEVAVVDLTAGYIVDEDLGTPGTNFLPVGQLPSGIAAAPDGKITYVAAAEINKPAIYALPSTLILGNSQQLDGGHGLTPPLLTTWPVCALPQTPGPITIIPSPPPEPGVDAGAGEAGASDAGTGDAGDGGGASSVGYTLAVVLPGDSDGHVARIITVDPRPLMRGGGILPKKGGAVDKPGELSPCTILGEVPVSGVLGEAGVGPEWPDGVVWLDGGVDASVPSSASCMGTPPTGTLPKPLPLPAPQPTYAARAGQYLYVADNHLPLVHVFDLATPAHPVEIAPLRASSLANPTRTVNMGAIAVSPPTRDYKRFLYAVDSNDSPASIMVFDVTDPVSSPHFPLRRPHSALVPSEPLDRIDFTAGVTTIAFVQHDWPLAQTPNGSVTSGASATGLLCNPNPNVDRTANGAPLSPDASADAQSFSDPGANYRLSSIPFTDEPLGPSRLRGIFAFATLSNGDVVTIDVDDWDAPCRRPMTMGPQDAGADAPPTSGYTSAIAPPEPDSGPAALDPYEAPYTGITNGTSWVSDEVFFPVSAPHRARSQYPLRDDPTLGIHYPYVVGEPQLYAAGADGGLGASVTGSIAAGNPTLLPTATTLPDPSALPDGGLGVRLAWEDPTAAVNQTWTIDFEGVLPSVQNIPGTLALTGPAADPYWEMLVGDPGGTLCSKGIEDWAIGQERAKAFLAASDAAHLAPPAQGLATWVGDYIQVEDPLFDPTDPYWSSDPMANAPNDCWQDFTAKNSGALTDPTDRYNTCSQIFGVPGDEALPARDFPIIEAYDDGLVITRYYYPQSPPDLPVPASTQNRQIAHPDPSNVYALKQLACCFHHQTTFNVRAGGEWLTTGSTSSYLHHVTVDPASGRCVTSCDPQLALLNSRAIGVSPASGPNADDGFAPNPDRDSPLAMRNPSFAFFIEHAFVTDPSVSPLAQFDGGVPLVPARPPRDFAWQFTLQGQLVPLSINLAATNTNITPQSMLFIPSLGQLAIVDGSQDGQGLILIDLNAVAVTGNSYY